MPSMSDPFHPAVKDEWLDQIFAVIALNPQVTVQMLTKRPERMLEYISNIHGVRLRSGLMRLRMQLEGIPDPKYNMLNDDILPLKNLHLGVSIENQKAADERIPLLLQTPAALRFLSVEPLLELVDLTESDGMYNPGLGEGHTWLNPLSGIAYDSDGSFSHIPAIDWIIVGGESGPGARPCDINWIGSIIQQCQSSRVPVFVKQLGSNPVNLGGEGKLRDRKGGSIAEWPEYLRIREFPV
jgi:protein gp37